MRDSPRSTPRQGSGLPSVAVHRPQIVMAAASAILSILSFPNFNLEFLAWIALIPLLFAIDGRRTLAAFRLSYLAGVIFFLGTIYWLIHVTLPGMIIVVLYLALYFGLFGAICSQSLNACKPGAQGAWYIALFAIPASWVAMEWLRSHLLTGFSWVLLGHSQGYNLPVIQIADTLGAYGVSFLIVMVNAAVFLTLKNFPKGKERAVHYVMIALLFVFLSTAYGIFRVKNIFTGETLKVAVIQGNIPQAKKWDANFRREILNKYEGLTLEAAKSRPDLIIWPETSAPGFLETERDLSERITAIAKNTKIPLLVGAPGEDRKSEGIYNSAVLFSEEGRIIDRYGKIHLVPFGEYVPFKNSFSFVERFAPSPIGDFSPGRKYTVFKFFIERTAVDKKVKWKMLKKVKFSCLICFEDIFPDLARQFIKAGAGFLVNITNDAWFKHSSAPYQHAQSSIFRAVENRVNVVRAANTGLSCIIDQKGKIVAAVESGGKNLFVDGFAVGDIVLTKTRTFYAVYGDLFAYLCMLITAIYLLAAFFIPTNSYPGSGRR